MLTLDAGSTPQTTGTGSEFDDPLAIAVTANDPNAPVAGGLVTYTVNAGSSGASGILSSGSDFIGSDGVAEITATANATIGSYTVTASAAGAPSVDFALTNLYALAFTNMNDQTIAFGTPSGDRQRHPRRRARKSPWAVRSRSSALTAISNNRPSAPTAVFRPCSTRALSQPVIRRILLVYRTPVIRRSSPPRRAPR